MNILQFWWFMNVTVRRERRRLRRFWSSVGLTLLFYCAPVLTAYARAEETSQVAVDMVWRHIPRNSNEAVKMKALVPGASVVYVRHGVGDMLQHFHIFYDNGVHCAHGGTFGEPVILVCGMTDGYYILSRRGTENAQLDWVFTKQTETSTEKPKTKT